MSLRTNIAIFLIISAALFVRFYNYENRIAYNAEQGLALQTAADYIHKKFTFLGQKTFFRTTSTGHILYSAALYNYSMVPLLLLFDYDPFPITVVYTFLNVFTGIVFFILVSKQFNKKLGFFTLVLFLFNDDMIARSLYFWILHTIPLISILTIYLTIEFFKNRKNVYSLFLGALSGIAFGLEYFYIFTALVIFILLIILAKNKAKVAAFHIVGGIIGNFSMVIFDIRNDFYYVKTLWQYFIDTINSAQSNTLYQYHLLNFWPMAMLLFAYLIYLVEKKNKQLAILAIALYLLWNLTSPKISFKHSEMQGHTYQTVVEAAESIANDEPTNFNIVDMPHLDFRAYRLRFLVEYKYKQKPHGTENYKDIDNLYVFYKGKLNLNEGQPWEITAFGGSKQTTVTKLENDFYIYKIAK